MEAAHVMQVVDAMGILSLDFDNDYSRVEPSRERLEMIREIYKAKPRKALEKYREKLSH